jgi:hypothetical protein
VLPVWSSDQYKAGSLPESVALMNQNKVVDFGALYRSAFAERDPERKQMLLNQVQRLISDFEQGETQLSVKLGPQSVPLPRISAVA